MELRRLVAKDSKTALQKVRKQCGDQALIVSTNNIGSKSEVIYAIADPEETRKPNSSLEDSPIFREELENIKKNSSFPGRSADVSGLVDEIKIEIAALKKSIEKDLKNNKLQEYFGHDYDISDIELLHRDLEKRKNLSLETQIDANKVHLFVYPNGLDSTRLMVQTLELLSRTQAKPPLLIHLDTEPMGDGSYYYNWTNLGHALNETNCNFLQVRSFGQLKTLFASLSQEYAVLISHSGHKFCKQEDFIQFVKVNDVQTSYCLCGGISPISLHEIFENEPDTIKSALIFLGDNQLNLDLLRLLLAHQIDIKAVVQISKETSLENVA